MDNMKKNLLKFFAFSALILMSTGLHAEILKQIKISGNKRIANETIFVYGEIKKGKNYSQEEIDNVIKKLYDTKFFSKISVNFSNGILNLIVTENPIINSIVIEGEPTEDIKM